GIGSVVVRPGPEAARLVDLVARQQDLDAKPTEQAALFQGPAVPQTAWVLPGENPPAEVQGLLTSPAQPVPVPDPASGQVTATGPGTVVLLVPEADAWHASVGGARLEPTGALGWAQGFTLPAGTTGNLEVTRTGQDRRLTWLLIEALLVLAAVATMARPPRPPASTTPPAATCAWPAWPGEVWPGERPAAPVRRRPRGGPPGRPDPQPRRPPPEEGRPAPHPPAQAGPGGGRPGRGRLAPAGGRP